MVLAILKKGSLRCLGRFGLISILINEPSSLCRFLLRLSKATARLNSLDLGLGERLATEAGGELVAVKVEALGGLDGAKGGAGGATNAGLLTADGLTEGTVLLGVLAVGAEGGGRAPVGGERVGGRGRVRLGGVVDGSCRTKSGMLATSSENTKVVVPRDGRCTTTGMLGGAGREGTYQEWFCDRGT